MVVNPAGLETEAADDGIAAEDGGLEQSLLTRIDAAVAEKMEPSFGSLFARFTEAPTNWHQMTAFYTCSTDAQDAAMHAKSPMLVATSLAVALMQGIVAAGVMIGTTRVSCVNNDQCDAGRFCGYGTQDKAGRCVYCASEPPYILTDQRGDMLGSPGDMYIEAGYDDANITAIARPICEDPTFPRQTYYFTHRTALDLPELYVRRWCDACVSGSTGDVNMETANKWMAENISAMGAMDFLALWLASLMVGLAVSGELKDIALVDLQLRRSGEDAGPVWRALLKLTGSIRRYLFLPGLVTTVPVLVGIVGGDALVRETYRAFSFCVCVSARWLC